MNVIAERFETGIVLGGRDGIRRWSEAAKFVEAEFGVFCVDPNGVVGDVPTHVHGDVLPAEGFQICGHEVGGSADIRFGNGLAVGIPTVPAHGWSGSDLSQIHCGMSGAGAKRERDYKKNGEPDKGATDDASEKAICVHKSFPARARWYRAREAEKRKN